MTRPDKQRWLLGIGLVAALLATRLPLLAKTLFEFDSIDFTVALFRFNLDQVTPHMPGYIVHVLMGRLLSFFISDPATMWGVLSTLLSAGSLLFLWRAAALLRGERVGLIAALLWLTTPAFWFYGIVSTVYIHEAFFASAILFFGIRLYRKPEAAASAAVGLGVALSLATGARQSSLLFFLPTVLYVFWQCRASLRTIFFFGVAFIAITIPWLIVLMSDSGGIDSYMRHLARESIYRSQSILYGNSLRDHLAVIGKLSYYLLIATLPVLLAFALSCTVAFRGVTNAIRQSLRSPLFYFVALVALPALAFYALVYFMKGGYLLNILPSATLAAAVVLDAAAIALAKKQKETMGESRDSAKAIIFTRPLILRNGLMMTAVVVIANIAWFVLPLPGKNFEEFANYFTHDSLHTGLSTRFASTGEKLEAIHNRGYSFTTLQSAVATDSINAIIFAAIPQNAVVLATFWSRWGYYYRPNGFILDVTSYEEDSRINEVGIAHHFYRQQVVSDTVVLPPGPLFLLMRADHAELNLLKSELEVTRVPSPDNAAIWRIELPAQSSFRWKDRVFIRS